MNDRTEIMFGTCPRPLSRKKMRSLKWQSRSEISGRALWDKLNRKPGRGRCSGHLDDELSALQKEAEKIGEARMSTVARALMARLANLFGSRDKSKLGNYVLNSRGGK